MKKTIGQTIRDKIEQRVDSTDRMKEMYYIKKYLFKLINNLNSEENTTGIKDAATFYQEMYTMMNCFHTADFVLPNQSTTQVLPLLTNSLGNNSWNFNLFSEASLLPYPFRETFNISFSTLGTINAKSVYIGLTNQPSISFINTNLASNSNIPIINNAQYTSTAGSTFLYLECQGGNGIFLIHYNQNINGASTDTVLYTFPPPATFLHGGSGGPVNVSVSIQSKTINDFSVIVSTVSGTDPVNTLVIAGWTGPTYFFIGDLNQALGAGDQTSISIAGLNTNIISYKITFSGTHSQQLF